MSRTATDYIQEMDLK